MMEGSPFVVTMLAGLAVLSGIGNNDSSASGDSAGLGAWIGLAVSAGQGQ